MAIKKGKIEDNIGNVLHPETDAGMVLIDNTTVETKLVALSTNSINYVIATGTANTYAVTINPSPTAYEKGMAVCVEINVTSTGASTINANGLGPKSILDSLGNAITSGGLKVGIPYTMRYNGTAFIVQGKGGGGNVTADKMLSGITATGDSGPVVGNIPSKAAQTYTPSPTAQTIAVGQYLSGAQTISATTGTATVADVVAGKTFNSANGIGLTGTATIASLGGKKFFSGSQVGYSGTASFTCDTTNTIGFLNITGFDFIPSKAMVMSYSTKGVYVSTVATYVSDGGGETARGGTAYKNSNNANMIISKGRLQIPIGGNTTSTYKYIIFE